MHVHANVIQLVNECTCISVMHAFVHAHEQVLNMHVYGYPHEDKRMYETQC